MVDILFQKLEEKILLLVSELEAARQEVNRLQIENTAFYYEKTENTKKLQSVIELLESVNASHNLPSVVE